MKEIFSLAKFNNTTFWANKLFRNRHFTEKMFYNCNRRILLNLENLLDKQNFYKVGLSRKNSDDCARNAVIWLVKNTLEFSWIFYSVLFIFVHAFAKKWSNQIKNGNFRPNFGPISTENDIFWMKLAPRSFWKVQIFFNFFFKISEKGRLGLLTGYCGQHLSRIKSPSRPIPNVCGRFFSFNVWTFWKF